MNKEISVIDSLNRDYNLNLDYDDINYPVEVEFDSLNNSRIVLGDNVKEMFNNISLTTIIDKNEIGFICYGMEYAANQVVLNEIMLSDGILKSEEVEFGPIITEQFKRRIDHNTDSREVVCFGHSHPDISEDYDYFSVGDLVALKSLTDKYKKFENKDMQLIGCLITKNIKFVYYNPEDDKFYKLDY